MRLVVGVKTFNPVSTGREDLLASTLKSVRRCFDAPVYLLDNGSTEDPREEGPILAMAHHVWHGRYEDGNHTPGRGYNRLLGWIAKEELRERGALPDLVVLSDDDVVWRQEARPEHTLRQVWSAPSEGDWQKVAIVSGLLEPEWHWNTPRSVVRPNGVPVLIRDSAPGAAWSFRLTPVRADQPSPIVGRLLREYLDGGGPPVFAECWGADFRFCVWLLGRGLSVGAVDLADHRGWGRSTHGNKAVDHAVPLDRAKWGI
jgi:hypothetical protein